MIVEKTHIAIGLALLLVTTPLISSCASSRPKQTSSRPKQHVAGPHGVAALTLLRTQDAELDAQLQRLQKLEELNTKLKDKKISLKTKDKIQREMQRAKKELDQSGEYTSIDLTKFIRLVNSRLEEKERDIFSLFIKYLLISAEIHTSQKKIRERQENIVAHVHAHQTEMLNNQGLSDAQKSEMSYLAARGRSKRVEIRRRIKDISDRGGKWASTDVPHLVHEALQDDLAIIKGQQDNIDLAPAAAGLDLAADKAGVQAKCIVGRIVRRESKAAS